MNRQFNPRMSDHDEEGILDKLRCPTCRRFPSEPTHCPDPCHSSVTPDLRAALREYAPHAPLHEDPEGALASFRAALTTIRDSAYEAGDCLYCGAQHPEPHHETCPAKVAASALGTADAAAWANLVVRSHQPWCAFRVASETATSDAPCNCFPALVSVTPSQPTLDVERLAKAIDAVPGLGFRMETGTCMWHGRLGCRQCRPVRAVDATHEQATAIATEYERLGGPA